MWYSVRGGLCINHVCITWLRKPENPSDPRNPYRHGQRELTLQSCPLISTCTTCHMPITYIHTYKHTVHFFFKFSEISMVFKNMLTPFGSLSPERTVCSSRQPPVCTVAGQQNRPSKCPSSSWANSYAFHPQPRERPGIVGRIVRAAQVGGVPSWIGAGQQGRGRGKTGKPRQTD